MTTENPRAEEVAPEDAPVRPRRVLDLLEIGAKSLTAIERAQIRFVRRTFVPGKVRDAVRLYQRYVGAEGVSFVTDNVREIHGLENVRRLAHGESLVLVSNHRSFFDMYTLTSQILKKPEMDVQLLFPVRSKFFYDSPAGLFVNGVMSAFAMYPPIFRERDRAGLNAASVAETISLVNRGGVLLGMHPEGKRNPGPDPYEFLPAQRGIGRIAHECPKAKIVPVFINGLGNDLLRQVKANFDGKGERVIAVFGGPIDFSFAHGQPATPTLYKELADLTMEHVKRLSEQERMYRALPPPTPR